LSFDFSTYPSSFFSKKKEKRQSGRKRKENPRLWHIPSAPPRGRKKRGKKKKEKRGKDIRPSSASSSYRCLVSRVDEGREEKRGKKKRPASSAAKGSPSPIKRVEKGGKGKGGGKKKKKREMPQGNSM